MAQRDPNLPEGTDHIINGAMETGTPSPTGTPSSTGAAGGASSGYVGSGGADYSTTGTSDYASGTSGAGGTAAGLKGEVRERAQTLKAQAGDKVRQYAVDGKERASTTLDDVAQAITDAAGSVDERLGAEYGDYARKAASYVQDLSGSLRSKDVDELLDDARALVRKSPVVAIGTAAAIGFALVRLIKAGVPDQNDETGGNPYGTTPNRALGSGGDYAGVTPGSTSGSASRAPDVYPTPEI